MSKTKKYVSEMITVKCTFTNLSLPDKIPRSGSIGAVFYKIYFLICETKLVWCFEKNNQVQVKQDQALMFTPLPLSRRKVIVMDSVSGPSGFENGL